MAKRNKQQASGKGFGKSDRKLIDSVLNELSLSDPTIDISDFDENGNTGMPFWMYHQFNLFLQFNKRLVRSKCLSSKYFPADILLIIRRFSYLQALDMAIAGEMDDLIESPTITDEDLERVLTFDVFCLDYWEDKGSPMKITATDLIRKYL